MANQTSTACAICKGTIPLDGVGTVAISRTRYACRSCLREAPRAELDRLEAEARAEATAAAAPAASLIASGVTRDMLRSLADRLMFTAPTAAELVAASVRRALDALNAGDLLAFTLETIAIGDALEAVRRAVLGGSEDTVRAIAALDPDYLHKVNEATRTLAIRKFRQGFAGRSNLELAKSYAIHMLKCTSADACLEAVAYQEELAARGIEAPKW